MYFLALLTAVLAATTNRRVTWADGYQDDDGDVQVEKLGDGVEKISPRIRGQPRHNVFMVNNDLDAEELANNSDLYRSDEEEDIGNRDNGPVLPAKVPRLAISNPINGGWFMFRFGEQGTEASRYFRFHSTGWTRLELTDLFCNGDRFVIVNRQDEEESVIGESSHVVQDGCATYELDPQAAMGDGNWSRAVSYLAPGPYNIHLIVKQTPYEGGSAAIRFTAIDPADVPQHQVTAVQADGKPKPASATGAGVAAGSTRFVSMRPLTGSSPRNPSSPTSSSSGRRGVVSSSGRPVESSTSDAYTSRTVNGPAHVTVHRPRGYQNQRTSSTRRSTVPRPQRNLQARALCAGWEGYVVLIGLYHGNREEVEEACEFHDMDVSMVPLEGKDRQAAARSISFCLGALQQAWIFEYEGYAGNAPISLQAKKDKCRAIEQRFDRLLPVLCRIPQFDN